MIAILGDPKLTNFYVCTSIVPIYLNLPLKWKRYLKVVSLSLGRSRSWPLFHFFFQFLLFMLTKAYFFKAFPFHVEQLKRRASIPEMEKYYLGKRACNYTFGRTRWGGGQGGLCHPR